MKKNIVRTQTHLTLGDLVLAVSSVSRNNTEVVAAVTDLLESGRIRIGHTRKGAIKARTC